MRVRIIKEPGGLVSVHARRTRVWEQRQIPELNIPKEQLEAAVLALIKLMRDDHRPVRLPGL